MENQTVIFDVETTGTDKRRDQVIELCVQFGVEGAESRTWRIRPSVPISPGAQAVHGISMDDLRSEPSFAEVADELRSVFDTAGVLVGYNVAFDIDMLQAEYMRLGQAPLALEGKSVVDAFRLWQQCEPRSLQDAHRRFVGAEFEAAHSASADVAATGRVLQGMISAFGLEPDWEQIAHVCEPQRKQWIGPSRHFQWGEAGEVVIGFGKHAGVPVRVLVGGPDAGYLRWMLGKDFPPHVHELCDRALALAPEEFNGWIVSRFGRGNDAVSAPAAAMARPQLQ